MDAYKWLWTHIGGRPWTYILRDAWDNCEFLWIVLLVGVGIVLGHIYSYDTILKGWLIFSLGYLAGHLFWGTPHIPDEKGT